MGTPAAVTTAALSARDHAADEQRRRTPECSPPNTEQSCLNLLRDFIRQCGAIPGQMLTTSSVRILLSVQGMSGAKFERALSFAKGQGWLNVADGTLTLTQKGYAAAIAK